MNSIRWIFFFFQEENIDITNLGMSLEVTISTSTRWFLREETFVEGIMYLSKFLVDSKDGYIEIKNEKGEINHKHQLLFVPMPNVKIDFSDGK